MVRLAMYPSKAVSIWAVFLWRNIRYPVESVGVFVLVERTWRTWKVISDQTRTSARTTSVKKDLDDQVVIPRIMHGDCAVEKSLVSEGG